MQSLDTHCEWTLLIFEKAAVIFHVPESWFHLHLHCAHVGVMRSRRPGLQHVQRADVLTDGYHVYLYVLGHDEP